MADTEEIIGRTEDGRVLVYFESAGDAEYSQADNMSVSIGTLRKVERILELGNNGGYRVEPQEATIEGNKITFPVRFYAFACPYSGETHICSMGWEVPTDTDLSKTTFSGVVIGH